MVPHCGDGEVEEKNQGLTHYINKNQAYLFGMASYVNKLKILWPDIQRETGKERD